MFVFIIVVKLWFATLLSKSSTILTHFSPILNLSLPLEYIRKPKIFCLFQGV